MEHTDLHFQCSCRIGHQNKATPWWKFLSALALWSDWWITGPETSTCSPKSHNSSTLCSDFSQCSLTTYLKLLISSMPTTNIGDMMQMRTTRPDHVLSVEMAQVNLHCPTMQVPQQRINRRKNLQLAPTSSWSLSSYPDGAPGVDLTWLKRQNWALKNELQFYDPHIRNFRQRERERERTKL